MHSSCEATPMQKIAKTPQDAILWNERAAGFSSEERIDGGVVVNIQMDREVTPKSSKRQGL